MAEKLYRSPQGSRTASKVASRNEKRNDFVANPESELLSLSYSSSSSSYLDISREYPIPPKKGIIRTFFTAPSERRRLRRHKSRRILPLNNSSSSSINTDLAYGTGFLRVKKRRSQTIRTRKDKGKQKVEDTDAALLALGAGLAAVAQKQNVEDLKASRRTEIFNASGRRSRNSYDVGRGNDSIRSTRDHEQMIVDEEGWESASEADSEASSYVDSTLAFGGDYPQRRGKSTVVDPRLFGPANSLHGHVTEPVGFEYVDPNTVGVLSPLDLMPERYEDLHYQERQFTEKNYDESRVNARQPLQTVFPIPTSDPTRFEATRGSVASADEPLIVRPGPVPLQQPQPRTPVSHTIYDQQAAEPNSPFEKKSSSYGKSIAGAALAGIAGAAVGSMIATDRSNDRKSNCGSDHEDLRKAKSRDEGRSERRSKRSDKDDTKSHRSSKRESRDGKVDREVKQEGKDSQSPPADRREKHREKRRDSEREEDPEERRARRRAERRAERASDERYSGAINPTTARQPVDPFQFQVAEDAFSTLDERKGSEASIPWRGRDPAPTVYTVEREPDFSAVQRSPTSKDHVYDAVLESDREPTHGRNDYHRDDRNPQDNREPYDVDIIHRENQHSTDAAAAAFAAQVAAAAAAGSFRGSRSDKRRGERRSSRRNYHGDEDTAVRVEDDQDRIIQEEADRAYRESVIARKVASKVIRERSPSPDAVDKYRRSSRDEAEEVQIITPPAMEGKKQPGPYDAPNADFELDRVMDPTEFRVFSAPQITTSSPVIDSHQLPTIADYEDSRFDAAGGRRPLLTLVRPTPTPSPAPVKKPPSPDTSSETPRKHRSRSQSVDDFVIDNKGNVKEQPDPSASIFSKAVTWGPTETKHYEVETPGETRDEFISSSPEETSKSVPARSREKTDGWGIVAGAIMGAAAGVTMAKSDASHSPETKPRNDGEHSEYRGFTVEPEDYRIESRQNPPSTGPKPTGTSMPGSFADDIDFTATLAAGLQDSGFDPNIVIDDPTYRKRMSPPGSDQDLGSSYRKPFAETVSDLGHFSSTLSQENRVPVDRFFTAEDQVQNDTMDSNDPRDKFTSKLSKAEQKKLERDPIRGVDTVDDQLTEELLASDTIVREPESYIESPKLSKKEQKKRDKAARRQDSVSADQPNPFEEASSFPEVVPEPEGDFEPAKRSKSKKSKRNSLKYDDDDIETTKQGISPKISVPIDAFDDIMNAHAGASNVTEDWDTPSKKSKKKSKRDSDRPRDSDPLDSPSQAQEKIDIDVPFSRYEARPDPSSFPLPMSTISDPDPADFPLPMSTTSQISRDEYADERPLSKSFRDSGIFGPSPDRNPQSVVPTGSSGYGEKESRKPKKKSRSSGRYDDEDTKSVASAPTYDDYESGKKAKKKSRNGSRYDDDDDARSTASAPIYDLDDGKKSKKAGFFGLFGISSSKSEPEKKRDESPKATADDWEESKTKKKAKRSSLADSSELYEPDARSSRTNGNGHRERGDDDNDDLPSGRRRHRSKDEKRKSSRDDKDSFLAKAGTLGAGVGLAGVAMAYAAHHLQSEATSTNPDGADIRLDTSFPSSERKLDDPEISQRPFRPSIDPQYGDLLPLPPSDPSSPHIGPNVDELPQLPDSRPETPESERRMSKERIIHLARRTDNQPLKSPSQSAIPLRFMLTNRSTPASPEGSRSIVGQITGATPEAVVTPRARARPTSWDSTKEFKPLYLVEHSRHGSSGGLNATEDLPLALKNLEHESAQSSKVGQDSTLTDLELADDSAAIISANAMVPPEDLKDAPPGQIGMSIKSPSAFEEPSPVEAASKTRTSYLLQDTPPSKKHTLQFASGENSPTPMERDEPFDVFTARDRAFDALSGTETNVLNNLDSPEVSNARVETLEHVYTGRTVDTNTEVASISPAPKEVLSSNRSSAIPLERNISVQHPDMVTTEPEGVDEDASMKLQEGMDSNLIEHVMSEFESQSMNDIGTDPSTENGVVSEAPREDAIEAHPLIVLEEPIQSLAAKSKRDGKKRKSADSLGPQNEIGESIKTETEQSLEAAPTDKGLTKPTAGQSDRFSDGEEPSDINYEPETQLEQGVEMPSANDAYYPTSTSKFKKNKKKKGSIQAWESEDPSTSIPTSSVEDSGPVAEFSAKKSKKGQKKSKELVTMQDIKKPLSEFTDSASGPQADPSSQETVQSLNEDGAHSSAGLLIAAISASGIANMDDELNPETHSASGAAPFNSAVQREQGPDGLAAGYKTDQLALAKQMKEEFSSGSLKKSKQGKKKSQSGTQTPDVSTPLGEEEASYFDGTQDRGRELEDSKLAEDTKPADSLDTGYRNDQLELARQLQAEFGSESKKSKKDKKKSRSTSRPATDEFAFQEREEQSPVGEAPADLAPSASQPKADGLEAGYKEDQLQLARDMQASFSAGSRKKKDKKRQTTLQSSAQDLEPPPPNLNERQQTVESKDVQPVLPSTEPTSMGVPSGDGFASGYNEEQLLLAKQLKEEFGKKSKSSKKDKKRQSLLRSSTFDDSNPDSLDEASETSGTSTPYAETLFMAEVTKDTEFDEGLASSKKSKKDKKKRRSQLQSELVFDSASDASRSLELGDLPVDSGINQEKSTDATAEPEEELLVSKKLKKEKKKRQSQPKPDSMPDLVTSLPPDSELNTFATPDEESEKSMKEDITHQDLLQPKSLANSYDGMAIDATDYSTENLVVEGEEPTDPAITEPPEVLTLTSKKSKKDKQKRRSQVQAGFLEDESPDTILEPSAVPAEDINAEKFEALNSSTELNLLAGELDAEQPMDGVAVDPKEEISYSTKKSKRDKKKLKSQLQSLSGLETPLESKELSAQDLESSYRDIPGQDASLQDGQDGLNIKTVPILETEPSAHELIGDSAADDGKDQPLADKLNSKETTVQEIETPAQGLVGSLPTEAGNTLAQKVEEIPDLTNASTPKLEFPIQDETKDLASKDPELEQLENDPNLSKSLEGKKIPQSSPNPESDDNISSFAIPQQRMPSTDTAEQSVALAEDIEPTDQESSSATKPKKEKNKKKSKVTGFSTPETELEQTNQLPIDVEDAQASFSKTVGVDVDNSEDGPSFMSKRSKKDKKKGKAKSQEDVEHERPNDTSPDQEKIINTTTEIVEPSAINVLAVHESTKAPSSGPKGDVEATVLDDLPSTEDAEAANDIVVSSAPNERPLVSLTGSTDQPDVSASRGDDLEPDLAATTSVHLASASFGDKGIAKSVPITAQEHSPPRDTSTNILETPSGNVTNSEIPAELSSPSHYNTSHSVKNDETIASEPIPQPLSPEDEFVFTAKKSKKDKKKKRGLDPAKNSETSAPPTPAEPTNDIFQKKNILDTVPVVEPLIDDSSFPSGKKSKKDKKKKRASVAFNNPDSETATGSSTPAELVIESNSIEDISFSQPITEPTTVDRPISEPADDYLDFSTSKKSKKDKKKKRASIAADPQDDVVPGTLTPVESVVLSSSCNNTEDTQPAFEPVENSGSQPVQSAAELIEDSFGSFTGQEYKEDNETKDHVALGPREDNAIDASTAVEPKVEARDFDPASAPQPPAEPSNAFADQSISDLMETEFTLSSTKKSKKDKKKKRASATPYLQENDSTTGASTPIEPLVEPENNQDQSGVDSSKDDLSTFTSPVETAIEGSNVGEAQDQPSLEHSEHHISISKPAIEASSNGDTQGLPVEEDLTKDRISTPTELSRFDVLLSQSVEQPIEDKASTPAEPSKLDNLLSQVVQEPATSDLSISPKHSKLDNLLSLAVEDSTTVDASTSLQSALDFDNLEDPTHQPSAGAATDAANDPVSSTEKKSKKEKKRKSGLNRQSDADNTTIPTPAERELGKLEDLQGLSTAEQAKEEPPASVQPLNLQDESSPLNTEPTEDEFGGFSTKKSKKDKKKRKSGLNQLQDESLNEPSTPIEPVADLQEQSIPIEASEPVMDTILHTEPSAGEYTETVPDSVLQEQSISREPVDPVTDTTIQEQLIPRDSTEQNTNIFQDVTRDQSSTDIAALEDEDPSFSTKNSKRDKKKRKSGLSQQDKTESSQLSVTDSVAPEDVKSFTAVEPAIESVMPQDSVPIHAKIATPEDDDFGFASGKRSKKDKKKRKSGLGWQESAGNTGASTPVEPTTESLVLEETMQYGTKVITPREDEFSFGTSKKSKKDKKKKGEVSLPDDDDATDKIVEPGQEIVASPIALEREAKDSMEGEWGLSSSKKTKKDKKKRSVADAPGKGNVEVTSTPADVAVASTQELLDSQAVVDTTQLNDEIAEPTTAIVLDPDFLMAADIDLEQELSASQADQDTKAQEAEDDEWGSIPSKKSKKDKKKRKGALNLEETSGYSIPMDSSTPMLEDTEHSKEISLNATDPGAGDLKDDFGLSAGKKSKKDMEKHKAIDRSEELDTTATQIPLGKTDSKLDQILLDDRRITSADDLKLPSSENSAVEQSILGEPSQPSQPVQDECGLSSGKRSKKDKKNRKTVEFSDELSSAGTTTPIVNNELLEQLPGQNEMPNESPVEHAKEGWELLTSKSETKLGKGEGLDSSKGIDTAALSAPTKPLHGIEAILTTSQTVDPSSEQDKDFISTVLEKQSPSTNFTEPDRPVQHPEDAGGFPKSKIFKTDEEKISTETSEASGTSMSTERVLHETPGALDPISAQGRIDATTIQPETIFREPVVQSEPVNSPDIILSAPISEVNSSTEYGQAREIAASGPAWNEAFDQPTTLESRTEIIGQPGMETGEEDSNNFVKLSKKDKKKRKSLLAASPSFPNDPAPESETVVSWANEKTESKHLQVSPASSGNSDFPKDSPEASSDFGSLSRKSSKKSKKRGKSEVDLAAAKVARDELATASHESNKVTATQSIPDDASAPPLKRGHFELSGGPEPDLATPDAEGVNPLLRAKFHGDMTSRVSEQTTGSIKQFGDSSRKSDNADKLETSVGLGVVAGLAARFEAPKADTKKSKKGKKKGINDNRSSNHDDLFDDPVLWEGAEKTALVEPTFSTEAVADDDFWTAPAEASQDEFPTPDAAASNLIKSDFTDFAVAENSPTTSRDIVNALDSTPSSSKAGLEDSSSVPWNENNLMGKATLKMSEGKHSRVDDLLANSDELSELRIPKTRSRNRSTHKETSGPRLQDSSPPASVPDLSPVIEEPSGQIPTVHFKSQPPALDPNRDSTLVDESPIPLQRGFEHDYIRDSGVQLRDWSISPAERKPEAVSDNALKRLSWPRVDDDIETVDLARPHEPSIKAKLDKHIDDIALSVAAATSAAAVRQFSPAREHSHIKEHLHRTPSPRSLGLLERSYRPQTPNALGIIPQLHTPEQSRAPSAASVRSLASNLSSATPPLRRSDKKSGDLRSLSQRSEASSIKQAEAELRDNTENNKSIPTAGQVHIKDMADVYDGFGEGRIGSPISPTRPPSMRRRQSMKVLDLEAQLHQLAEENRMLSEGKTQAEQSLYAAQRAAATLADRDAEIDSLKQTIDWLHREVSRLTEVNEGLSSANITMGNQHDQRYNILEAQHNQTTRELQELRESHANLSTGMQGIVHHELENTLEEKNREIAELYTELEAAKEQIRELQRQILAAKANDSDFLTVRDEDYFEDACQQLCGYVQQWVLRFSKFSDMRACRLTSEISNEKIVNRLDNAVLDASDVDQYLSDRVKRRDIFMSMTMMMVWEFVFTRYLFGMDREQRQKLKSLEKILAEVGPQAAVHHWRATTLTLLAKREAFLNQREQDTEAVVQEIFNTLSEILPPPSQLEDQIQEQLRKVMKVAVDLSIEMRTQRAEYMMLPPLRPEYDANGDLAHKFPFNAALMNERSGDTVSNEDLEKQGAVVRVVLFPLVVKKGDDRGEGDEEIVVCPAQVLVAKEHKRRSASGRNVSGGGHSGVMGGNNASRLSIQSSMPGVISRDGSPF